MFRRHSNQFTVQNASGQPLVHNLTSSDSSYYKNIIAGVVIILLGVFSGYILTGRQRNSSINQSKGRVGGSDQAAVGSKDSKTFRDSAEGDLKAGGNNGEGTHSLIRPGGESQTVSLTSSVLDLTQFEGKKVRVWGETFAGQSSGWFMDVGKVEVIE